MAQLSLIKEKGNLRLKGIDADRIANLLAERHLKDVFVTECKNGETWGARDLLKLDAWVLQRTYSPLTTIGYEIKTSRHDFENDQKWTGYIDLSHLFYFVCPAGLIRAIDLPQQIGLIWVSQTEKLHIKRKAERVTPNPEKLNRLLIYVLMARSKIVANMFEVNGFSETDNLKLKRDAVERANEKKELAYFIKGHVHDVSEMLKKKESDLTYREHYVRDFEKRLAQLGITWNSEKSDWQDNCRVGNEIDALKKRIDYHTLSQIKVAGKALTDLGEIIENIRHEAAP